MSPINVNVPPPVPETKTEAKTETETKDPKPVETDETVTKLKEEEAKRQEQDEKEEKERALVEEGKIEELKKTAKTDEEMAAVEKLETAEAARKEEFRTAQEKKRQAALLAISKAGEQAAKGLSDMGLARAKAAESYRQQKMEFLKEKLKIQEEERKNLVNMAEYATRMTQAADAKGIEENIIQSLSQAIGALRRISVILRNNAQFWTQMATACEKLGGQKTEGLRRDINRYKGKPERLCVATSRVGRTQHPPCGLSHHGTFGSRPRRSFTAHRSFCLHPRYRSVVWIETCPSRN